MVYLSVGSVFRLGCGTSRELESLKFFKFGPFLQKLLVGGGGGAPHTTSFHSAKECIGLSAKVITVTLSLY